MSRVKEVVIVGGGTAGWMAAAGLSQLLGKNLSITLIESDEIGTVGVGEATLPTLTRWHQMLKIDEREFIDAVQGTFKLGIRFEHWGKADGDYMHAFGTTGKDCWACGFQHFWLKGLQEGINADYGDYCVEDRAAREGRFAKVANNGLRYAYHLDAGRYARFLRKMAEAKGVQRIEGMVEHVATRPDDGFIESVQLRSGQRVTGDLFIDCSGGRGLLIGQTLQVGYDDWSHWLPCDRAVAVQASAIGEPAPYTRSMAHESGWQWRIPLQHRVGNGMVYCSQYQDDDEATRLLLDNLEGERLTDPRVIRFRTGQRQQQWHKNCVALGLSSGFMEPLESTSIHLIQRGIIRLMQLFPLQGISEADIAEYNRQTDLEIESIRDFIILHYRVNQRESDFWQACQTMPIPDSLQHRIELFQETGKLFRESHELFSENSWVQVLLGQGIRPRQYHPIVDAMQEGELERFLGSLRQSVRRLTGQLPSHQTFLDAYAATDSVGT